MFNRYWRNYPWGLQLALFMLTLFTIASFSTYLVLALMPRLSGISFTDFMHLTPASPQGVIRASLISQAISHAGTFALPALLFASFAHPRMREYLGLRAPGKPRHWLLVTGIMAGLIPVFLWGEAWTTQHMHFGKWADEMQAANDSMVTAFLRLGGGAGFVMLLAVLAALPAFGEELVFRGVILRLLHRRTTKRLPVVRIGDQVILPDSQRMMVFPVIFTALLFAAVHFNPYGFVFIFVAGCVLALIYFLTGSLLCSMWAHFLYNGLQVGLAFFSRHNEAAKRVVEDNNLPAYLPLGGLLLFAGCFYALVKSGTPLPPFWSDDFSAEERESASAAS